jgi:hypothetical protein
VAIQLSGTFGSRQEEAQRLGRILRPKRDGQLAHFYSLVTRETRDQEFAANRQKFRERRVSAPGQALPVAIDEDAVRRLCGAAFARADALQRAGHVLAPRTGEGLTASVRGDWRRIDRVAIHGRAGRLFPNCTRDGEAFCRHAGAVLLQWIRAPDSFVPVDPLAAAAQTGLPIVPPVDAAAERESPAAELARLFELDTLNHLREIARRRGTRVTDSKKADVIGQLAKALADPAGIDAALESLTPTERLALDAIHLGSAERSAHPQAIGAAFALLGGQGEPPIASAVEAGLAVSPDSPYSGWQGYIVPRAVAARLPALDLPVRQARGGEDRPSSLGIVEMLQIVAQEVLAGDVEGTRSDAETGLLLPDGLTAEPVGGPASPVATGFSRHQVEYRLMPQRLLAKPALQRIAARTGQPDAAIDFVARLMMALDIVQGGMVFSLRRDRLQALLELPPNARLARLARGWVAIAGPVELGLLAGRGSRLRFR